VRSWGLSAAEQDEVWARWRRGESLRLIARRLGKRGPSVRAFVLQSGGVQQHPPRRAPRCLTMAEREEISRGVAGGETIYLSLFVQSRGALRRELQRCLRTGRGVDPAWWTPKMRALPSRWESDATPPTVLPAGVQG
jgi:hypothetical protein